MTEIPQDDLSRLTLEAIQSGQPSDELVQHFYHMAEYCTKAFYGYREASNGAVGPEDAVQEGVMACLVALPKYDILQGHARPFFLTAIRWCYLKLVRDLSTAQRQHPEPSGSLDEAADMDHDNRVSYLQLLSERQGESSTLMNYQVEEIKKRLAAGERQKDIAEEFGVHKSTVSRIKNRETT